MADPISWVIIGGGVVSAVGAGYEAWSGHQQTKREAEQQKALMEYNEETALGTMDRELAMHIEEDQYQAGVLRRQADWAEGQNAQNAGMAMQDTYLTSLGHTKQIADEIANNELQGDAMTARAAVSGVRNTGSVSTARTLADQAGQANVDYATQMAQAAMNRGVSQNIQAYEGTRENLATTRQAADRRLAQYEEGSEFMDLYNYRRERITGENDLRSTYLDDLVDASFWDSLIGGTLGVGASAANAYTSGYKYDLWGNRPTASYTNPVGNDEAR